MLGLIENVKLSFIVLSVYLKFTNNNNIKIKHEIDGKINIYSYCVNCDFKKFETINEDELSDLLKILNYI